MANANNSLPEEPRRWAPSRIASAAVLVLLVLGGIAYGIYSLTSNNTPPPTNHPKSSQPTTPNQKAKTTPKSSSGKSSASNSSASSSAGSNSGSQSATPGASSQLSNTGPGDTALVGFVTATVIGALAHYGWRKHRSAS